MKSFHWIRKCHSLFSHRLDYNSGVNRMNNIQLYPLTNAQQRIWYSELLYPNTSVSQLSGTVKMKGKLDITVFMKAVNMIIEQYDALRIRITSNNGIPQQYVMNYTEKQFDSLDFADFSSVTEAESWLESQKNKPLPLLDSELFQFLFIKISEEEYWLNTKLHHIIADGISMVIFGNQLTEYYIEMMNGNDPELGGNCSYIDYITIEQNYVDSEKYIKDQTYWLDKFADLPEQIGGKSYNPLSVSTSAVREHFTVPNVVYQQITEFCKEHRISIFQFFMGMMYIYIHKTTNQSDVTIGTSLANRGSKKEKQTVGMFVSTIAARMDINQNIDILQFLKNVTKDQMSILRHQKYPYNQLIQDLREKRHVKDLQRLFNISMEYRPVSWVDVEGVRISTDYDFCGDEINDFVLHIAEIVDDNELVLHVDYRTQLFDQKEIARMIDQLLMITQQSISNPQGLITDISLLNEAEKATILSFSEGANTNYPKQETIHHLFEQQSMRNPDHIAVQMGDKSLTYRELNQHSNRLARQLRAQGIQADTLVGIMVERSLEMIVGILAILKAGGAYVPIDPEYPEERIQYIINDSSIYVLLTQSHLQNNILFNGNYIYIDHAVLEEGDDSDLISISGPNHLAYVIYTSGTTGQPKGTLIEHKNVVRLFFNDHNLFDFSDKDVWTLFHSFCFDFSVWEMYGAILHGGKLIIVPSNIAKNPESFLHLLKVNKVTILNQTPTYFYQLLQNELKYQTNDLHLRNIIFGGEALSPSLLQKWRDKYPYIKLINMYGITETTVHVTYKEITETEIVSGKSNIGITIPTLNAYILDEQYRLQPIGVPGELHISGEGLARGYLNLPEVTSERFISHPLRSDSDERVYRTGDLARWLPDGNIEYLGRIDHQVKIRGYRIELGEIESQILKIDEVQETIVIARLDDQQEYLLCAYYVTSTYLEPSILRKMLNQVMPAYMIPSYFVHLDHMPLTSNGKLDRNALPEPAIREQSDQEYIAPRTMQEKQLVEIWKNVLGSQNISMLDNFFEIGGHSLRATQLSSKIHQELNVEISLRDIFQAPTIETMAILLAERSSTVYISIPKATQNEYYPVSSAQKRLYVLNQLEGGELSYNMTGVFTVEGELDQERLLSAFNQLINNHESLRTSFSLIDGEPVQHIHSEVVFDIEQLDMKDKNIDDVISSFVRPFNLHQAPLIRVGLTSQKENKCLFLIDMHHIISDGISVTLLTKELTRLYQDEQITVSSIQYKDYAVWQRQQIEQNNLINSENYWLNTFENDLPVLDIPLDYPRPSVRSFAGNTFSFTIDEEDTVALKKLAKQTETTLYMVLLAAYSTFLYKYTSQEDIIIGSPVAGRAHTELDHVIGMFVNTLALRTYPTGKKTFNDYLYEVKETVLQSFEHQYYPLEILVDKLQLDRDPSRNPIFDTLFVLQNTEQTDDQMNDLHLEVYPYTSNIAKFDLSLHVVEQENKFIFSFEYATALYHLESIKRFANHLKQILHTISNNQNINLNKIEVITPIEKKEIIECFNATAINYPNTQNIYDLFKEKVNHNPNQIALVYGEKILSYKELDEKSGKLAQTLSNSGIKQQQSIAIISHRSIEMVIAMIATLRIGAVYVPIDPDYPFERVNYMLQDTQAPLLLVNDQSFAYEQYGIPMIDLTKPESYASTSYISKNVIDARELAYIMYTSGTTGNPKGVMIEHRSIIRLVKNTNYIQLDENTKILQTGAVAFDASTFEIWGSLLNGGQLYFIDHHDLLIVEKLKKAISSYKINTMWLTSPLFNQLSQEDKYLFNGIQTLIIGGDVLSASHINAVLHKNPQLVILNGYGPTENTTFSTIYRITESVDNNIPIGKPISNSTAYIVDQGMSLQPVGAWGELLVGGDGIARGYLNLPELNKEKFISDFMDKDQRFYRTGDLARWKLDGTLEYKGRIDEQVKIRGYRIELSEVEAKLLQINTIQSATVIVRENERGEKQLCAYYVSNGNISASEIRIAMVQSVPSYMVPSYFVQLSQIPLTANGKVNRKQLPAPHTEVQMGYTYMSPKTEEEQILVNIWEEILGINSISIYDNFFELGGDSIKAIQVSSRLLQVGYRLEMKELFKSSTIAQLALLLQVVISQADQESVQGEVLLNPIQTWFLNRSANNLHHFNQSIMLYNKEKFDEEILHQVMNKIVEHHDALRLVFHHDGDKYTAYNRNTDEGKHYDLRKIDLHNQKDPSTDIRSWANYIQSSIDLDQGPLVKLGLFQCIDGDHLLIVIHHLVVDGISWRILLEDIRKLYSQFSNGEKIILPFKTDSFQKWTASLSQYAQSDYMNVHEEYWNQWQNISFEQLPKDMHTKDVLLQNNNSITANLTVQETTQFITEAHRAYKTEPNDLLLSALSIALNQWSGIAKIAINLEGHGRESIIENIDITRTVGWFTSQFPVILEYSKEMDTGTLIQMTKEHLRDIPAKGIGYGLLKYKNDESNPYLQVQPEISFNYLGQFDQDLESNEWQLSNHSMGDTQDPTSSIDYVLDINGMIIDNALSLTITYNANQYHSETIDQLVHILQDSLKLVLRHCLEQRYTQLTPSDVQVKGISTQDLKELSQRTRHLGVIKNIYTLTPMQKGMLFHHLLDANEGAYFEQAAFDFEGDFNAELFGQSLNKLVTRHDILRTHFYNDIGIEPLQVVFENRQVEINYEDIRDMDNLQCNLYLETIAASDKRRGFDFEKDLLLRMSIIRTEDQKFRIIWSFHHIIMDGWCIPLITREVFEYYFALVEGKEFNPNTPPAYSQYIEWIEKQDKEEAALYWSNYLSGYSEQTLLPKRSITNHLQKYKAQKVEYILNEEFTLKLEQIAREARVTMNVFIQSVWGVVLQRYNNSHDVVYGTVVSGRPAEISGIEKMIGLFINTIPVRVKNDTNISFSTLMKMQQEQYLSAQPYSTYPLFEIQAQASQKQDLISHILVFENYPIEKEVEQLSEKNKQFKIHDVELLEQSNYDFNLLVLPGKQLKFLIQYNDQAYKESDIQRIQGHIVHLLEQIVVNVNIPIHDLELITPIEQKQLIDAGQSNIIHHTKYETIHNMLEQQALKVPDQMALLHEEKSLTYHQLNSKANKLAQTLLEQGIKTEENVVLLAERSIDMIVGMYGIMKAGCVYIPVDPSYPTERIRYMLEDSQATAIITQTHLKEYYAKDHIVIDLNNIMIQNEECFNLNIEINENDLAYMIYTSGTTGQPKGVMVEHRGVWNLANYYQEYFKVTSNDRIIQFASLSFDASISEIIMALSSGASLYIPSTSVIKDYMLFEQFMNKYEITIATLPPTYAIYLEPEQFPTLRCLLTAGSSASIELINKWKSHVRYYNAYGPTEDSVCTTIWSVDETEDVGVVSIGTPIANHQIYILDDQLRLQPIGVSGELYIGGIGLARGYYGKQDMTNEKFVPHLNQTDQKMYRTGDQARWLEDGTIEYLGRIDHQVKIRGYRIEPAEVETQLLQLEHLQETIVIALTGKDNQQELCAYFVADQLMDIKQIQSDLSTILPSYMIPSRMMQLKKMPITPNGKISRENLPEIVYVSKNDLAEPKNQIQQQLIDIWEEVLSVENIGIDDNFFDLGGHSLKAALMISKIRKEMNYDISLKEFFQTPTIQDIELMMEKQTIYHFEDILSVSDQEYYPISSAQKRLFILNQMEGGEISYNMPGVLKIKGNLNFDQLEQAFIKLIERHDSLRTCFVTVNGEPVQKIMKNLQFSLEYVSVNEEQVDETIQNFLRPFVLEKAPLLRVGVIQLQPESHILMFDMHHIISDAISMNILIKEIIQLYQGMELSPLQIQYTDYAVWQQKQLESESLRKQEAYWLTQFNGYLPILDLPTDKMRPAIRQYEGSQIQLTLDYSLSNSLRQLAEQTKTTLFMVLLATYKTLLHKYTGQEDIIVGSPIAGRSHASLQNMIGMFVGTLPLRTYPAGEKTFEEYLLEIKDTALNAYENQDYPFEDLVRQLDLQRDTSRHPLFDTMFVLQNAEENTQEIEGLHFTTYNNSHSVAKFDLTLTASEQEKAIELTFEYATSIYTEETVQRMMVHLVEIMRNVANNHKLCLLDINMMTVQERTNVLATSIGVKANYPNTTIHKLFEKQVALYPEAVAVVDENKQLTYQQLNELANGLARTLRQKGVKTDCFVGIIADRSVDMVVSILAILKAGGAYVPIDIDYPEERVRFMLEDSNTRVLLLPHNVRKQVEFFEGTIIEWDRLESYDKNGSNLDCPVQPNHLAYVIYTSGTTGKPKGTLIEHKNVVRLLFNDHNLFDFGNEDTWTLFHSCCFDFSVWEMYGALLYGGKLIIVPALTAKSPNDFLQLLKMQQVTILNQTPTYFYQLMQEEMLDINSSLYLRMIIFGGEALNPSLLKEWKLKYPATQLINMYGITETTVHVTYKEITEQDIEMGRSNIGTTIPTLSAYILDNQKRLQPFGIAGELYIAGEGLARGYLNRPEMTQAKFINHVFEAGSRMYRSGDLARWLPDGTIEYLGRIDHQVKIRGYRIELGEIEIKLLEIDSIREATVIAYEEDNQPKALVAYFIADENLTIHELRKSLAKELPGYMIPSYFVQLDNMPLTANGKLDRKSLPKPEVGLQNEYALPRNEVEQTLINVWQSVLGAEKIGIEDHFFELGGDSIKAIQISSRLFQSGYQLDIKDLFKFPTIAELSPYLKIAARQIDQSEVEGRIELLPIQQWFFEKQLLDNHHYNHAVMLYREEGFNEKALHETLNQIVIHHDALRTVFKQTETEYVAWNRSIDAGELYHFETINLHVIQPEDISKYINHKATEVQQSLNLTEGPLLKSVLFQTIQGDHLLIVIHHLVVDGISWRILFEDISSAYEQAISNDLIVLPQKTDSYLKWSQQLADYAKTYELANEKKYWVHLESQNILSLRKDHLLERGTIQDSKQVKIVWSEEETALLLKQANRAYYTETNDLLLTALGMAIEKWSGISQMLVSLEGHGRETVIPNYDVTRTVGWFTTQYPVLFQVNPNWNITTRIKQTKETLRTVPNKGIGYGLLKYMTLEGRQDLNIEPEISFNYLGQFDQDVQNNKLQFSNYDVGEAMSKQTPLHYTLDINGMVIEGELSLSITYSANQYEQKTIQQLADLFKANLSEVIRHCVIQHHSELTPSDITVKGITIEQLEDLITLTSSSGEIEDVYSLTSMQKGMLFHSLLEVDSVTYFEQAKFELSGVLDIEAFTQSFQLLANRHSVLRTNFLSNVCDTPVQVVFKNKQIPVQYVDLRQYPKEEQDVLIKRYEVEDMNKGFVLSQDALMRVMILQTQDHYKVLWSFHHIIIDGWCIPIITQEIFEQYAALCENKQITLPAAPLYKRYIEWLDERSEQEGASYWHQYLEGYEGTTSLPEAKGKINGNAQKYVLNEQAIHLGKELTQQLDRIAKNYQVTVNTLLQTVWGLILQQYNNSKDVVFGGVVSGRPADIQDIENMIGLFINTIPVRIKSFEGEIFTDLLQRVQRTSLASSAYDTYPLYEIQSNTDQKQDLISHIMIFENYPLDQQVEQQGNKDSTSLEVTNFTMFEQTNYDFNLIVIPGDDIQICMRYNTLIYESESIARIGNHILHMLEQIKVEPMIAVEQLHLVTSIEHHQLLNDWSGQQTIYPNQTIQQLFEEQVQRTPDQIVAVYENQQITYQQLNEKSNQLAAQLISYGLQKEQTVGLMMDRSFDLLIGILGVIKAGGVYVPIDPEYPQERIEYILQDSAAEILLTQSHLSKMVAMDTGFKLELDLLDYSHQPTHNRDVSVVGNDLVYLIYTSGTTGNPKGTMITHQGLVNYIWWAKDVYTEGKEMSFPLYSSISFDLTVTSIFTPLISGGIIYIYDAINKAEMIQHIITENNVDILKLTPTHLKLISEMVLPEKVRVKKFIVGGENLTTHLAKNITELFNHTIDIYNEYGPTETVVGCMIHRYDIQQDKLESVPIGMPAANAQIYILDDQQRLVTIGVPGEIYIAGDGVARGYLNRPDLTAEKFVQDPFVPDRRMYRTGDLARRFSNGQIEYLGRLDHQVKIRGYRIELGEVEGKLLAIDSIIEAVAVAWKDSNDQTSLCAYFVSDIVHSNHELRNQLNKELPSYMVPSYLIQLDSMPLTPNGKLDRKSLPAPNVDTLADTVYIEPRTEIETLLVSIWQKVLGVSVVGVYDNFFELGGDSIKAIQVSSRLFQSGYRLEIKDLFAYPTIAELNSYIQVVSVIADQSEVVGRILPTPAQQWFLEKQSTDMHHFNQSILLHHVDGFNLSALQKVWTHIVQHHDALRMVLRLNEHGYEAWNRSIDEDELYRLTVFEWQNKKDIESQITIESQKIQQSISLDQGPLVQLALFRCIEGDHLLIVIHHLVVDGVSWRIILEDLEKGYHQALQGEDINFLNKTDSYQAWAKSVAGYADTPEAQEELLYWNSRESNYDLIPKDYKIDPTKLLIKNNSSIAIECSQEETEQFMKKAYRAYTTEANDLLLTALGMAVHQWAGIKNIGITLEGHGREDLFTDLDISRTVGWFTSQYPVLLQIEEGVELGTLIKKVKEELRHIPNKGAGYGVLKYLSTALNPSLQKAEPEIVFNYLGQFDQNESESILQFSPYSAGSEVSENMLQNQTLTINGIIEKNRLKLTVNYNQLQFEAQTIQKFASILQNCLSVVITHCVTKEHTELTPYDVLLQEATVDMIEELENKTHHIGLIENIYKLTPMQQGMLFHHLLEKNSGAYFEQARFELKGQFNVQQFENSFKRLIARHAVLRTNFYNFKEELPIQVVFKQRPYEFEYEDLSHYSQQDVEDRMATILLEDKVRGFNLGEDPLLRMKVIRISQQEYILLWSFHHIIMDGWCMPLVIQEVFETYASLDEKAIPELPEVVPYSRYIQWLEQQDTQSSSAYWNKYLEGYNQQTNLPEIQVQNRTEQYVPQKLEFALGEMLTQKLERIAKQNRVTLNIVIQSAWGLVLQRYNNNQDVVFGSVVSGRPSQIEGIENMVGLFINTVPTRIQTQPNDTFTDVIKRQQQMQLDSHAHDFYPLYEIQAQSEQKQDLISHIMVFENYPVEDHLNEREVGKKDSFTITDVQMFEQTNYDFNLIIMPGQNLKMLYRYNANMHKTDTVTRIQEHLIEILKQVTEDPAMPIEHVEMITKHEKSLILDQWNNTVEPYSHTKLLHSVFEEKALLLPNQVALIFENQNMTYQELDHKANRLARTLRNLGVVPDQPVGIMVERSLEMVIGILAILKAGGAYVPIDPLFPEERIQYMIEDSGTKLILTHRVLENKFSLDTIQCVRLEETESYHLDDSSLENVVTPKHLAYIIYTSGSTGKPKGVMIEHRSAVHTLSQLEANYPMSLGDKFLLKTTITFDFSVPELFCWFFGQGTLMILPPNAEKDPKLLLEIVDQNQITHLNLVPSMLNILVQYLIEKKSQGFKTLKYLFACGETLPSKLVEEYYKVSPHAVLENIYGPTEATVYATRYTTHASDAEMTQIPIGKPYNNVQIFILNASQLLVPIGVPGELYISGEGLARGYFNRDDITSEVFLSHPYQPGNRIYRTGDLARWSSNGNIEYLGRIDHQVKIRGHRIELGEVESQLAQIPSIQEVAVSAIKDIHGSYQLCAYFVAQDLLKTSILREALGLKLPSYMVPSAFIQLTEMPHTPNGKLDRKALPAPEQWVQNTKEYIAPRTKLEIDLALIWSEVLGVSSIGVEDDFFDLGGHSLKVLSLIQKIESRMDIQLSLPLAFSYSSLEAMADQIIKIQERNKQSIKEVEIIRFHSESQMKVFSFPPRVGYSLGYYEMAKLLEQHCEVVGLEFIGDQYQDDDIMLNHYVDMILNIQKEGPYIFLGYSLGGNLAFEVAKAMEKRGHLVRDVIMIDAMRKTKVDEMTLPQVENVVDTVLNSLANQYQAFLTEPSDRQQVRNKMIAYSVYRNELINEHQIQSNIHALIAEVDILGLKQSNHLLWQESTRGEYSEYPVIGTHDVLLESGYIQENSKVLKKILEKIRSSSINSTLL